MKTLEQVRPFFLARTRREKLLCAVFLAAVGLTWLFSFVARARSEWTSTAIVRGQLAGQALWLDAGDATEAAYEQAMASFSAKDRPTKNEVLAQVQGLLNKHGFAAYSLTPPTQQVRDPLTFHTYNLSINRAGWDKLQAFYRELTTSLPTVNVEHVTLSSVRNTDQLDARFRLVGVEFNR